MHIEHGKIEGDVEISSELKMHGTFTGNVTVKSGGKLILHGLIAKSLILEEDSIAEVPGMVAGRVINNGGILKITGTVCDTVVENLGETFISDGAQIGKTRVV